jgi:hypothetical protein
MNTLFDYQHTLLADAAPISFGGFQRIFYDVWDFFFPNIVILALIYAITRYVGGVQWLWIKSIWSRIKNPVAAFAQLLQNSNLPGARLLPLLALIMSAVLFVDVFQVFRSAAKNFLPPSVHTKVPTIYEHLVHEPLFLKILLGGSTISSRGDVYGLINHWRDRVINDEALPGADNVTSWNRKEGEWNSLMGDVKLLGLVTVTSLLFGIRHKSAKWRRFIGVSAVLVGAYVFFMAKYLYAAEQEAMAVVSSYERYLSESENDDLNSFIRRGADNLKNNKSWLVTQQPSSETWWEMSWFDSWFYQRAWKAITHNYEPNPIVLTDDEVASLQERLEKRPTRESIEDKQTNSLKSGNAGSSLK